MVGGKWNYDVDNWKLVKIFLFMLKLVGFDFDDIICVVFDLVD